MTFGNFVDKGEVIAKADEETHVPKKDRSSFISPRIP